jgi:hypothetical protein
MIKMRFGITGFLLGVALLFFWFCGGGESPTSPSNPAAQPIANPSFATDIQSIFTANCVSSGCHNATASAGLILLSGQAYNNLVNVRSTQDASKNRVLPNDATNSYLIIKLEGRQTTGVRMPLGRAALSSVQIQNIKNWISMGANNN